MRDAFPSRKEVALSDPSKILKAVHPIFISVLLLWLGVGPFLSLGAETAPDRSAGLPSYETWVERCAKLPANRVLQGRLPPRNLLPLSSFREFDAVLTIFLTQSATGPFAAGSNWVGDAPDPSFCDTNIAYFLKSGRSQGAGFQPFALKAAVPAGSEVFFRGDLHGDVHSLLANVRWLNEKKYLEGFKIVRPDFYMIFLGDYTDRGSYGIEVLYTLFRLKTENPDRVFLSRGNHEELSIQSRYGFLEEARAKYGQSFDATRVLRAYDFLPVVVYLGSGENFIQCNHGGMEPGYNPRALLAATEPTRFQLLGVLRQKTFLQSHPEWLKDADAASREWAERVLQDFKPEDPISPSTLGFMWNDFSVLGSEPQFAIDPGRAFVFGRDATRFILDQAASPGRKLQAVFRAHQQSSAINPMMRRILACGGVFRHWQAPDGPELLNRPVDELRGKLESAEERAIPTGSVWTFNVSPDSVYGQGCNYAFDTFGLLKVAENFKDWRLKRVNLPIAP